MTGWLGNIFLLAGHFCLGSKNRISFLLITVGELLWLYRSFEVGIIDGMFLCSVFAALSMWNWHKWRVDHV
jgi:hypothetical protein